ncbi:MAG: thioredoxin family protein [Actinomycetota bacterium]
MVKTILALAVLLAAAIAGYVVRKKKPDAPVQVRGSVPSQVDRQDFSEANKHWLVAVFTSSTCDACRDVAQKARVVASNEVAVQIIDFVEMGELHKRYEIDSVPTTLIADSKGVVMFATVGPVTATDLWAALARCRDPQLLNDIATCDKHGREPSTS